METFREIYGWLLAQGGIPGLVAMIVIVAAFFLQLWYYGRVYGRIPLSRSGVPGEDGGPEGLSVIITLRNADYNFLDNTLPAILGQDYAKFEVVLVNLTGDADFTYSLSVIEEHNPRVHIVKLTGEPAKKMSNKMILNVGIKGARYDNFVFTTSDCTPVSDKWLAAMANGFRGGDIVIGYCGIEPGKGTGLRFARMDNVAWSARWFGAALRGRAYRGTASNFGFTRKIYFDNDGFNHLNLNIGEDDLFILKIRGKGAVVPITAGKASVRKTVWGGWYKDRKLSGSTFRFYPSGLKVYIGAELWSRALFFAAAGFLIAVTPVEVKAAAAALLLLRFLIASRVMRRICRRFSERGVMRMFPVYDLAAPVMEAWLMVSRRIKRPEGLWR